MNSKDLIDLEGWPEGTTQRNTPRLFKINLEGTCRMMPLAELLQVICSIMRGSIEASKAVRFQLGSQLTGVIDRIVEFQNLYDSTIPLSHEYDPAVNPQRGKNGLLLNVMVDCEGYLKVVDTLIDRESPFRLQEIAKNASPEEWIMKVHRVYSTVLRKNSIMVNAILEVEKL